ncbi:uncharacterized protein LY89DRAFT_727044 [Mollisia scopiformis]|uniref:Uncharacterized protein n=1 Tax=Mollisia scopiformis TaxID=149040 RepID=A0A194XVF4_MOLSC|nr:uncharacterized protein LY89DRAFT_727044 [Mollisia scopiformis]KUJ23994.1 hypothetical protein LY89DRAFT_727044 [Mollisia scopiformis]
MHFNSLLVLTGLLSTLSLADPIPQSPAQTTALANDLESYIVALATDTAFLSFASALQTNAALSSSVSSFEASMSSLITHRQTPTAGYISAAPTDAQTLLSSIYSVEYQMLSDNGFLATSSSKAAAPTQGVGSRVKVAGAVAAGFVGAVIAL